jgi:hypothetical protein
MREVSTSVLYTFSFLMLLDIPNSFGKHINNAKYTLDEWVPILRISTVVTIVTWAATVILNTCGHYGYCISAVALPHYKFVPPQSCNY